MNALVLIAAAALAAEPQAQTGWEKLPGGGYRYIIQILPEDAQEVIDNYDIECEPPQRLDVRQVKVTVGKKTLPQDPIDEPSSEREEKLASEPAGSQKPTESPWENWQQEKSAEPKQLPDAKGAQPAGYAEPTDQHQAERRPALGAADAAQADKPWLPLVLTGIGLLVSVGVNFYLGWLAYEARRRYRALLERMHETVPA